MPSTTRGTSVGDQERRATIRDVAALAGVSRQTVSRYTHGDTRIQPETRERIETAIDQLKYRPNRAAWSLTTGRTTTIGALILELDDLGPARMVKGAIQEAREAGYVLDIIALDRGDKAEIAEALEAVQEQHLAGVLSLDFTDEMAKTLALAHLSVPLLISSGDLAMGEHEELDEPAAGVPALVEHLVGLGHRRLLHIGGPETWPAARKRAQAFAEAAASFGVEWARTIRGDWSAVSGHDAIANYGDPIDFTCVVAANDRMALGAIRGLRARGLSVPDDVSVTGLDDVADAAYYSPPLTTLRVDFERAGRGAMRRLIARIEGKPEPQDPFVPAPIVIRSSTGQAKRL